MTSSHLQCFPARHFYVPCHLFSAFPITNPSFTPHQSPRDTMGRRTIKKVGRTSDNTYCPHCTMAFQGNNLSRSFWYHLSMSPLCKSKQERFLNERRRSLHEQNAFQSDSSEDDIVAPNNDVHFPPLPDSQPEDSDHDSVLIPDRSDHLRLFGGTFPGRSDRDIEAHLVDIFQLDDDDLSLSSIIMDNDSPPDDSPGEVRKNGPPPPPPLCSLSGIPRQTGRRFT